MSGKAFVSSGFPVKRAGSVITTAGAGTYTAAQIISGYIFRDPSGAGRTDTLSTAALLVAAISGVAVNDAIEFTVCNTADAAEAITITAGSGGTLYKTTNTDTIAQNETAKIVIQFTNVTASSEAYNAFIVSGNAVGA